MEVIDLTKLSFPVAVKVAMKEFGLNENEATEFINQIQGDPEDIIEGKDDMTLAAGKEASIIITKDYKGKYRWTLFSGNAFEDRDGEVVSLKALQDDLEQSEKVFKETGSYGPLRWWHCVAGDNPEKDGLDIGQTDFRMLVDRVLVESGTFNDEWLGAKFAPHAKELGASIGFYHLPSEPDRDKVFHKVRIFERSLLPAHRASNPYTQMFVQE